MQAMIVSFDQKSPKLHEWLYDIVKSICYDREYSYRAFYILFSGICGKIFENGSTKEYGDEIVYGIKSEYNALISYKLMHRLNYSGLNEIHLKCEILNKITGESEEIHLKNFELSLGQSTN